MNREAVYAALFEKLANITGIVTSSRRLLMWDDVPPASQPALFQTQIGEVAEKIRGAPTRWRLSVDVHVYVSPGNDPISVPSIALNSILDSIETALAPDSTGEQTLGNLVSHCSIIGKVDIHEGLLGGQVVAIIPIEILTA